VVTKLVAPEIDGKCTQTILLEPQKGRHIVPSLHRLRDDIGGFSQEACNGFLLAVRLIRL
jgi:hypothetical protein